MKIVQHVLNNPLPHGTLLNVTFPEKRHYPVKGFRMTHQGKELLVEDLEKRKHPVEGNYYWLGLKLDSQEEVQNSEITWLKKGYCTASPLHIRELTDHSYIQASEHHFNGIEA